MLQSSKRGIAAVVAVVLAGVTLAGPAATPANATPVDLALWNLHKISLPANDLEYDPSRAVVLATIPGSQPNVGNELVELNPVTGLLGRHVRVGSDPTAIAVAPSGSRAYVALRGADRIVEVDLATFTVTRSFSIGLGGGDFGPIFAEDLLVKPSDETVVVASLQKPGFSPAHEGVAAFDDGVRLASITPGHTGPNRIEVDPGTGLVHGYNGETGDFGLYTNTVDATGVHRTTRTSTFSGFGLDIEYAAGALYASNGQVGDQGSGAVLRTLPASGPMESMPDGMVAYLQGATVKRFADADGQPIDSRAFAITGAAKDLERAGAGLAALTSDGIWLLGPDVAGQALVLPVAPSLADLQATPLGIVSNELAYDATRNLVYATIGPSAASHPNELVAIDPLTRTITKQLFIGSDPRAMAITGDGSKLYIALDGATSIAIVNLSTFAVSGSILIPSATYARYAEDLLVVPGTTTLVVASLKYPGYSPRHAGVGVFDNGTLRPTTTPGHTGADRIEQGASPTVVYGQDNETSSFEFYAMAVTASGIERTATTGYLLPGFGTEFEVRNERAYSTDGSVADAPTGQLIGRTTSGVLEADTAQHRIFVQNGAALSEFDLDTFRAIGSRTLAGVTGTARALIRHPQGLVSATSTNTYVLAPHLPVVKHDFTGDGLADRAIFREGAWYIPGQPLTFFGLAGDVPVPADYNGNGTTDIAVYRGGDWLVGGRPTISFGLAGDIPVPADYDGDGDADIAIYRPSVGGWYILGQPTVFHGTSTDIPVPADYDGDGDADVAVWRPSSGGWHILGQATQYLGLSGDVPVPADYDGGGTDDLAVWRPSSGGWHILGQPTQYLGLSGDVPAPGRFGGLPSDQRGVWRPPVGAWYVEGQPTAYLGLSGDIPLPLPWAIYSATFGP